MSELEREAEKAFMASVSLHLLTKLSDGSEEIVITNKIPGKIGKDGLTKRLKTGWVLSEDYNENHDTIVEWKRLRTYISDWKEIVRGRVGLVAMVEEDIARIESGDLDEEKSMLPIYRENLEMWQRLLVISKQQLEEPKIDIKPLKASIKSLKDKFKLYISQLEDEQ